MLAMAAMVGTSEINLLQWQPCANVVLILAGECALTAFWHHVSKDPQAHVP